MSATMLPATCIAGVVTVLPILPVYQPALPNPPILPTVPTILPGAIILSGGVGPSIGFVVIDGINAYYVANISISLKLVLDQLVLAFNQANTALTQIATTLTSIAAGMTGPTTAPPPTIVADVLAINTAAVALAAANTVIGTLKEVLP